MLRHEYKANDDYGVEGVKAIITRKDDPSGETLVFDLPLPGEHLKAAAAASYHDLTPHPWAGLPVEIKLQAVDALGQTGDSETVETVLPERQFHHPIARAIIEARKELTLHPEDRRPVAETLSDLSLRPGLFNNDVVVFMALRTAQARLVLNQDADTIPALQRLLRHTALRIEDGARHDEPARSAPGDAGAARRARPQRARCRDPSPDAASSSRRSTGISWRWRSRCSASRKSR